MTRTIIALFQDFNDADRARDQLSQIGVRPEQVDVHQATPEELKSFDPEATQGSQGSSDGRQPRKQGGFFDSLKSMFLPDEDRGAYEEGLRRGHALLSVQTDESRADEIVRLLDKNTEALDVEEKSQEWRESGWAGPNASAASLQYDTAASSGQANASGYQTGGLNEPRTTSAPPAPDQGLGLQPDSDLGGAERPESAGSSFADQRRTLQSGQEERIPIVEERLAVDKREVERGGARVRSYVVERPVHEQVSLREEHVSIERRPVDQPLSAADDAFRDRELEVRETAEEAVVAKEARVVEELVVRKDQDQRTETIDDTVRHTEVDVDDGLGLRENRSFEGGTERFTDADREPRSSLPGSDPNLTSRP
jgi:uncharacterized protein (TIGR02271 family)